MQNTDAAEITFSTEELAEIDTAARAIEVLDARLPDAIQVFSHVDAPNAAEAAIRSRGARANGPSAGSGKG